jgi:hypothetical protein
MRPEEPNRDRLPNVADLPNLNAVDASDTADNVKGGATDIAAALGSAAQAITPRDPATGLPTGKR